VLIVLYFSMHVFRVHKVYINSHPNENARFWGGEMVNSMSRWEVQKLIDVGAMGGTTEKQ
jgi:hypothetical protein